MPVRASHCLLLTAALLAPFPVVAQAGRDVTLPPEDTARVARIFTPWPRTAPRDRCSRTRRRPRKSNVVLGSADGTHHLHASRVGSPCAQRHLDFRDYLRPPMYFTRPVRFS
jgi:hypothetical protein